MEKNIGLVGCGAWGKNILRDLLLLGCRVCVADTDLAARRRSLESGACCAVPVYDSLPPCDGYVVAVPIPDLTPVCAGLLRRRKPVFSEKTLCLSLTDYECLRQAGGGDLVFAMHKWRYHPGVERLRAIAGSGVLGDIGQIRTVRHAWVDDFHGGDVFWTQAVHDLTIVRHILGFIPDTIRACGAVYDENGVAVGLAAIMGDSPAAVLSVSGRHPSRRSGVAVLGTLGAAELRDAYDGHIIIRTGGGEQTVPVDTTYPLFLELREFIDYLGGGPRPRCGLGEAGEVTRAILSLKESAAEKRASRTYDR